MIGLLGIARNPGGELGLVLREQLGYGHGKTFTYFSGVHLPRFWKPFGTFNPNWIKRR